MAHAYTTKRGKNKKSKLGVRKDQQQNQERNLKSSVGPSRFDGPRESVLGVAGRLTSSSQTSAHLETIRSRVAPQQQSQRQLAIGDKCSNPACTKSNDSKCQLSDCSGCHQARYCGRECQVSHWSEHKVLCKEVRKRLKEVEEAEIDAATADVSVKMEGLKLGGSEEIMHVAEGKVSPAQVDIDENDCNDDDGESGDDD